MPSLILWVSQHFRHFCLAEHSQASLVRGQDAGKVPMGTDPAPYSRDPEQRHLWSVTAADSGSKICVSYSPPRQGGRGPQVISFLWTVRSPGRMISPDAISKEEKDTGFALVCFQICRTRDIFAQFGSILFGMRFGLNE
jgi:hypothetical protein